MWETLPNNADWDCFKTPILREILRIQNPLPEGKLCVARGMGSPRQAHNRRRRTREGPEPACVQTPVQSGVAHAGGEG